MRKKKRCIEEANKNLESRYLNRDVINEKWYHNVAGGLAMAASSLGGDATAQNTPTQDKSSQEIEYVQNTSTVQEWKNFSSLVPEKFATELIYVKALGGDKERPLIKWKVNESNTINNEGGHKNGLVLRVEMSKDTTMIEIQFSLRNENSRTQSELLKSVQKYFDSLQIRNEYMEWNGPEIEAGATISLKEYEKAAKVINTVLQEIGLTGK